MDMTLLIFQGLPTNCKSMNHIAHFKLFIVILCYLNMRNVMGSDLTVNWGPIPGNSVNSASLQHVCGYSYDTRSAFCNNKGLHEVPDDIPYIVYNLNLSYNKITRLFNASFVPYLHITHIDVSYNDIMFIDLYTFYPLKKLASLDLSNNRNLKHLNADIFNHAHKLSKLSLRFCELSSVPDELLTQMIGLDILLLSSNNLSFLNITSCSSEMDQIDLSLNKFQEISHKTFTLLCNSQSLYLNDNPISKVDSDTISNLQVQYLKVSGENISLAMWNNFSLGIAKSPIQKLQLNKLDFHNVSQGHEDPLQYSSNYQISFGNMKNVKELFLEKCNIQAVEPEMFNGMEALRVLSLKINGISYINHSNSSWNGSINTLDLSYNSLSELTTYAFYGLQTLTFLDLSSNPYLRVLEIKSFFGLRNLQKLNVVSTNLQNLVLQTPLLDFFAFERIHGKSIMNPVIFPGVFNDTPSLQEIIISNSLNARALLDSKGNPLFHGLKNLTALLLEGNDFITITSDCFPNLPSLQILELELCKIYFIGSDAFAGLQSLRSLNLRKNMFHHVPSLHNLYQLTELLIDDNNLMYINKDAFVNTSKLHQLTLSNNFFTGFNDSTFSFIEASLTLIDIAGNPLQCNCEAKWLFNLLRGNVTFSFMSDTFCSNSLATLDSLRGKRLSLFDPSKLCQNRVTLYTYLSISLACLVLLSTTILVYHFRWLLGYKLFLLKLAIFGYKEIEDARKHEHFDYDFNIMFTGDAEDWVGENFRPFRNVCRTSRGMRLEMMT